MHINTLEHIRQQMYSCFEHSGDALFSESQARSLPELSLSIFFERRWPSVYEALQDGLIYVVDIRNGLYVLQYTGPHADEVKQIHFLEGNSNLGDAVELGQS
jgi:hypothetical protein